MLRRSVLPLRQALGRRNFSDHGHEKVKYEGLEAKIRTYFPEQHDIVIATLGAYAGLFVTFKVYGFLFGSKAVAKKVNNSAAASPATKDDGAIPSIADAAFDAWVQVPGNAAKWEGSLEGWAKQ